MDSQLNSKIVGTADSSNGGSACGRANSHWPAILAEVGKPDFQPADFVRLILKEMSLVCRELTAASSHSSLEFKLKPLLAEVHALRTLAETTRFTIELRAQADTINFDGPKFAYLLDELIASFTDSLLKSGIGQHTVKHVTRLLFEDLEPRLNKIVRNINKIVAFPEEEGAFRWPKNGAVQSAENSDKNAGAANPES